VSEFEELVLNLRAWLSLALPSGLVFLALWVRRPRGQRLLPPPRRRAVPWGGYEVLAAVLAMALWPSLLLQFLPGHGAATPNSLRTAWAITLALPLEVATILLLFRRASGTLPYQLGLTTDRARGNAMLGFLGWLVLTPAILGLYYLVLVGYSFLEGVPPPPHPLTESVRGEQPFLEWALLLVQAVVAAPVVEELVFRGVLQQWLARRPWGGAVALVGAALIAASASGAVSGGRKVGLGPVVFVLLMVPGYLLLPLLLGRPLQRRRNQPLTHAELQLVSEPSARPPQGPLANALPRRLDEYLAAIIHHGSDPRLSAAQAIYGTALLFAGFHSAIWPSPIPLFVLALGLGWLAHRTQSLVGPIVWHSLFNGVACVVLALSPN
jgi:membrane protease YdiL (CAAX protease family)